MTDYLFLLFTLLTGYILGIGSRWVVKTSIKDYIDGRLENLYQVTTSYTQKVQIQCDQLIEQANTQAIAIYKEAINEAAKIVFEPDSNTDLN